MLIHEKFTSYSFRDLPVLQAVALQEGLDGLVEKGLWNTAMNLAGMRIGANVSRKSPHRRQAIWTNLL